MITEKFTGFLKIIASTDVSDPSKIDSIIIGVGGRKNIVEVGSCCSRLRFVLKNLDLINEEVLKKAGAIGVVKLFDGHVQVVYGLESPKLANSINCAIG